ncbi:hypothetical protein BU16DRAFT_370885 [Lophium mytilinum]|uniref:Zn(2)-C6 fungal-type domain-containing protein n=1 Tax=Lophium mytilinum TaxID=390894 RepID=A0A6A6QVN3_9PEZI|nr:hypothetical protein BU16DRAFT_370885 [Lophium mytilinum]
MLIVQIEYYYGFQPAQRSFVKYHHSLTRSCSTFPLCRRKRIHNNKQLPDQNQRVNLLLLLSCNVYLEAPGYLQDHIYPGSALGTRPLCEIQPSLFSHNLYNSCQELYAGYLFGVCIRVTIFTHHIWMYWEFIRGSSIFLTPGGLDARTPQTRVNPIDTMISSDEHPVRVRQRYTLHACIECQRRKRKCTGGANCRNCRQSRSECVYTPFNRSKKQKTAHLSTPDSTSGNFRTVDPEAHREASLLQRSPDQNDSTDLASRTQTLQQNYETLKRELAQMRNQERGRSVAQQLKPSIETPIGPSQFAESANSTTSSSPNNVFEQNTKFACGTSFFHQIDVLDRSVARDLEKGEDPLLLIPEEPGSETIDYENLSVSQKRDLDQIVDQTRLEDVDRIMQSIDVYFANIQPHYPCINEAHFRAQFAAFLANDTDCMSKKVYVQFAVLLNFMIAVSRILYDTCTSDENPPGCKEFHRAEKILSHAPWLEKASIMTIQILLIKSSYCLYISRLDAAYDTMGTAIRLCFQLGLHNEPSWGADCTFYDRTYRQRLFWSLYCLNHNVAQHSGVPNLLRSADFDVAHPACVDDRMLAPNCPSLPSTPRASPIPFLLQIIAWANLSSTIWDAMFGVHATPPVNAAFIAAMDSQILALSHQTPAHLVWPPDAAADTPPPFLVQQSFVLYLRIRALRMLLRRGEMVSLRYEPRTAQLCIGIAAEMVAAVELSYASGGLRRAERYAYALHLTGVLVPVICVIVRRSNGEELVRPAVDLFERAMRIMEAVAGGLGFARRMLMQLRRPIGVAREVVEAWALQQAVVTGDGGQLGARNGMETEAGVDHSEVWSHEGGMAMEGARGEQGVGEWRPVEGELVWEDLDLWNNIIMSNWQS